MLVSDVIAHQQIAQPKPGPRIHPGPWVPTPIPEKRLFQAEARAAVLVDTDWLFI